MKFTIEVEVSPTVGDFEVARVDIALKDGGRICGQAQAFTAGEAVLLAVMHLTQNGPFGLAHHDHTIAEKED